MCIRDRDKGTSMDLTRSSACYGCIALYSCRIPNTRNGAVSDFCLLLGPFPPTELPGPLCLLGDMHGLLFYVLLLVRGRVSSPAFMPPGPALPQFPR